MRFCLKEEDSSDFCNGVSVGTQVCRMLSLGWKTPCECACEDSNDRCLNVCRRIDLTCNDRGCRRNRYEKLRCYEDCSGKEILCFSRC